MKELDSEKFGAFLVQLRKEKGLTQKELADKLFVSDKAVSKWERGASLPDITRLTPLAEALGASAAELLCARRLGDSGQMDITEVEDLVEGTIGFTTKEHRQGKRISLRWRLLYAASAAVAALGIALLLSAGFTVSELSNDVLVVVGLCLLFGAWFCFWAKEELPVFYDQNRLNFVSNGIFRMNIPGVRFSNNNWPHILFVGRVWMLSISAIFPLLYFGGWTLLPTGLWHVVKLPLTLCACLGFLIAMIVVGKRYE